MRYTTAENSAAVYWSDDGVGYVVSGPADKERLKQVARQIYDQTEKAEKKAEKAGHSGCPNSDIENLESNHRRVSLSHRMITRK